MAPLCAISFTPRYVPMRSPIAYSCGRESLKRPGVRAVSTNAASPTLGDEKFRVQRSKSSTVVRSPPLPWTFSNGMSIA